MMTSSGGSGGGPLERLAQAGAEVPSCSGGTRAAPCAAISACSRPSRLISKAFIGHPLWQALARTARCAGRRRGALTAHRLTPMRPAGAAPGAGSLNERS